MAALSALASRYLQPDPASLDFDASVHIRWTRDRIQAMACPTRAISSLNSGTPTDARRLVKAGIAALRQFIHQLALLQRSAD